MSGVHPPHHHRVSFPVQRSTITGIHCWLVFPHSVTRPVLVGSYSSPSSMAVTVVYDKQMGFSYMKYVRLVCYDVEVSF